MQHMIGSLDCVEIVDGPKSIGLFGQLGEGWALWVRMPDGKVEVFKACEAEMWATEMSLSAILGWRIRDKLKKCPT